MNLNEKELAIIKEALIAQKNQLKMQAMRLEEKGKYGEATLKLFGAYEYEDLIYRVEILLTTK